jgi:hypothetical protein
MSEPDGVRECLAQDRVEVADRPYGEAAMLATTGLEQARLEVVSWLGAISPSLVFRRSSGT